MASSQASSSSSTLSAPNGTQNGSPPTSPPSSRHSTCFSSKSKSSTGTHAGTNQSTVTAATTLDVQANGADHEGGHNHVENNHNAAGQPYMLQQFQNASTLHDPWPLSSGSRMGHNTAMIQRVDNLFPSRRS